MAPTANELKAMADPHVQYEVDEFRASFDALKTLNEARPEWNRTLESALFHCRVLRGFFFSEGHQGDNVYASHYVGKWPHTPLELDPTHHQNVFARTKANIDKRLAHLTTERLKPHVWTELNEMRSAMEALIGEFKTILSAESATWFPRLTAQVKFTLGPESASTTSMQIIGSMFDERFYRG